MHTIIPEKILGTALGDEQKNYLEGFFNGLAAQGVSFSAVTPSAHAVPTEDTYLIAEERIKKKNIL